MGLFTALLGIAKLLVLLWLVFVSSFLGTVLVVLPAVPLTVVAPKLGLRICGAAVGSWALLCVWLVEQVDWVFLWSFALRARAQSALHAMRILFDSYVQAIPGPGWALQAVPFPLLQHNPEVDRKHISKMVQQHVSTGMPLWLTSFPEGQSLYGDTLRISRRLMQAQGLEPYNHVLYSLDGDNFANCVSMLGANCAVYDVTIAYPELRGNRLQLRPSLMRLLRGRFPAAVHIHVSRHERKELPSDGDKLKQWLQAAFRRKEARLSAFYEGDKPQPLGKVVLDRPAKRLHQWLAGVVWLAVTAAASYAWYQNGWVQLGSIVFMAAFVLRGQVFRSPTEALGPGSALGGGSSRSGSHRGPPSSGTRRVRRTPVRSAGAAGSGRGAGVGATTAGAGLPRQAGGPRRATASQHGGARRR